MKNLAPVLLCVTLGACAGTAPRVDTAMNAPAPTSAPDAGQDTSARPRVGLVGAAYTLGDRTAPVALVAYADYQCPYCARFHHGMLGELKAKYIDTGVLLYVHKDFPLRMHRQAVPASIVARCAGAQGRYGAMQGRLYEAHANLGDALYAQLATTVGLDLEAFNRCRADASVRRAVERDIKEGERVGVTATPTLMLGRVDGNSVVIERIGVGLPTLDVLIQEIERLRPRWLRGAP